jgi:hypothetical protein
METNVNTEGLKKQMGGRNSARSERFEPFQWVPGEIRNPEVELLGEAKDILSGVSLVLQIIEDSELEAANGDLPLFNENSRSTLQRFAISACNNLQTAIDRHLYRFSDAARGGK